MAKKMMVKEQTVKRINSLLEKYLYSVKDMKASEEFASLYQYYLNKLEKGNIDKIVELCAGKHTVDEIRFIINSTQSVDKKSNYSDPVEEGVFLISQQKVVEVDGPVDVIIEEVESVEADEIIPPEEEKENHDKQQNSRNEVDQEEPIDIEGFVVDDEEPELLEDMLKSKKTEDKNSNNSEQKKDDGEVKSKEFRDRLENIRNKEHFPIVTDNKINDTQESDSIIGKAPDIGAIFEKVFANYNQEMDRLFKSIS